MIPEETKQRIEKEAGRLAHTFTKEHTTNLAMKQMFEQVITAEYNRAQDEIKELKEACRTQANIATDRLNDQHAKLKKQRELLDEMAEALKIIEDESSDYMRFKDLLAKYSQLKSEKE